MIERFSRATGLLDDVTTRSDAAGSGGDAELALQLFTTRTAHAEPRSSAQLNFVISTRLAQQRLHQLQLHYRRSVNAQEDIRVEALLERLHRLTNEMHAIADVELRIGTAGRDV